MARPRAQGDQPDTSRTPAIFHVGELLNFISFDFPFFTLITEGFCGLRLCANPFPHCLPPAMHKDSVMRKCPMRLYEHLFMPLRALQRDEKIEDRRQNL